MTKEDARVIERILYDYPEICLSLKRRSEYLEASDGPSDIGLVQMSEMYSTQEKVFDAKQQDAEHCELSAVVECIADGFAEATDEMRMIIERVFFRREHMDFIAAEMFMTMRYVYQKKYRALKFMESFCLKVYPIIRRWREREESRRRDALRLSMKCG